MAASPFSEVGESVTDCPQCGYLCLGPTILPCDHLTCRKCLRHLLQQHGSKPTCRSCGRCISFPEDQAMLSVSHLVQQLGTDPVMEHLVLQELRKQTDVRCNLCPNRKAANVCLDCQEHLCIACSNHHQRLSATKDHDLKLLPQALQNIPKPSKTRSRPRIDTELATTSTGSIKYSADTTPQEQSRGRSRVQKDWKQWVEIQLTLLQSAANEQDSLVTILKDIVSLAEQHLKTAEREEQLLSFYTYSLLYYSALARPDAKVEVNTEALERRLHDVRSQSAEPATVESIKTQLEQLLQAHDEEADPFTKADKGHNSALEVEVYSEHVTHETEGRPIPRHVRAKPTVTPIADPMTTIPRRVFVCTPTSDNDYLQPLIISLVSVDDDKIVMSDYENRQVKVVDFADPSKVCAFVELREEPLALAVLSDGLVAVTTGTSKIYLLHVSDTVSLASTIETVKKYWGVAGSQDDTLIVSCRHDTEGPARVDVITRGGDVMRTVIDDSTLPRLERPRYLCAVGDHVYVSDCDLHTVYKVRLATGQVLEALKHQHMDSPLQVAADDDGNLFVSSADGQCLLVRSSWGEWRRLRRARDEPGCDYPSCVCVTRSGRLVVAWEGFYSASVLTGYDWK